MNDKQINGLGAIILMHALLTAPTIQQAVLGGVAVVMYVYAWVPK